jgi:hypothetical protein
MQIAQLRTDLFEQLVRGVAKIRNDPLDRARSGRNREQAEQDTSTDGHDIQAH